MHDLLHDLAIFLAGNFYCRIEELCEEHEEKKVLARHFSHIERGSLGHPISEVFNSIVKMESLRTSLYLEDLLSMESMASKLKYLRVLSFRKLDVLPDSIGELIHLRYLNLSWTKINRLPESLCDLYNLRTLILHGCTKLTMLPNGMHNLVNLQHLDLRETHLKEMPGGISKLKQLRTLDYFVVGKNEDSGVRELGGLLNLHGSLHLKKLENIVDVKETENARMINKNLINELYLEWSSGNDMVSNTQIERDILDSLQPHNGLKELTITEYKGTIFPNWVGHSSYNKMTSVSLESCNNCFMLPSLGLLPSLKKLRIEGFRKLISVGMEFYKNEGDHRSSSIALFPSLEELEFRSMPCWEEWYLPDSEAFPQIKIIMIKYCLMLKKDMLSEVLTRIVSSSSDVSKVRKLEIKHDDLGYHRDMRLSGDTLSVWSFTSAMQLALKAMIIRNHLCCLQEMHISDCLSAAVSLRGNFLPKSLQILKISCCRYLKLVQGQHKYDLVELQIERSCDSLTWLSLDAFPNLKTLSIEECSNLESVSMSEPPHAALQSVKIKRCDKLVSFAGEGLAAPNLTHLELTECEKLEALPSYMNTLLPNLHTLRIDNCDDMCRVPEGGLSPNLKHLDIHEPFWGRFLMVNIEALTRLSIHGSIMRVKSFPYSLPQLPSLTTLNLSWFDSLETLECNELIRLTSLQELHIQYCWNLQYMEGEKLPSSLLLLDIFCCGLLGEECKNKHEQIWPKIEHIPTILVDGQQIV
ncbi:hypothetical protein PIB30_002607 [Stylosanthes scabra]|uniref:R13L1/DRL21-like LRR repeat region domain-containing protein n=1 Tax=Stylosanthes scabra TaxID=79078 RepID=A0ABU6Z008_9FABA|nr:hypothetical protein [Stylosanthes scabra]